MQVLMLENELAYSAKDTTLSQYIPKRRAEIKILAERLEEELKMLDAASDYILNKQP